MSDEEDIGATKEVVAAANKTAAELMAATLKNLKELPDAAKADPATRFFFPHGIEVIYFKVDAYFNDKIHGSVVIEIAGEKTIPPTAMNTASE